MKNKTKTKYLLDTNVILRLILRDDQKQYNKILELFNQAQTGKINLFCPSICIFEVSFVLLGKYYKTPKSDFIPILETLLSLQVIDFENRNIFGLALEIFKKQSISFVDSYLVAKSKIEKYEFFSFDQKATRVFANSKSS